MRRRDTLHHSNQATTSAGAGRALASPYAVSIRKASHDGAGRGAGGQRCHHPLRAIEIVSVKAIGHNPGRRAKTKAASTHHAPRSRLAASERGRRMIPPLSALARPARASGREGQGVVPAQIQQEGVSCGCRSATADGGASRRVRHPCPNAARVRQDRRIVPSPTVWPGGHRTPRRQA